jgi:phosphoribosyl 1,2-cyclic phosphodiesterase/CheY-like chemotaxis protein
MRVRFWGTRGSVPSPGAATVRYGGNTSCVEVRTQEGALVVLDCGTGAISLGRTLLAETPDPIHGALLIGHTHWDHIQGFPFFAPLFVPGNHFTVYGPDGMGRQIERALTGQMVYEHFPLPLAALRDQLRLVHLHEGRFEVGGIRVTTQYLNHPVFTLGYRLEADGATLVYATDFEPFSLHPLAGAPGTMPSHPEDQRHIRFLEGADLVIHDAQYTLAEFPAKTGWGHMPIERAVDYALLAGVPRLALFHHDSVRDDEAVDHLLAGAQARAVAGGGGLQVVAAAEGQVIELPTPLNETRVTEDLAPLALPASVRCESQTVLLATVEPGQSQEFSSALEAEGLRVLQASQGEVALRLARLEQPSIVLLDRGLPGLDGLEVCRALRAEPVSGRPEVPIVMLGEEKASEADLLAAFAAGATDYVSGPVKATLLRSRVRAWLLRTAPDSA